MARQFKFAVIDIQDAFHCIPAHPEEQRFQATVFQILAEGSGHEAQYDQAVVDAAARYLVADD